MAHIPLAEILRKEHKGFHGSSDLAGLEVNAQRVMGLEKGSQSVEKLSHVVESLQAVERVAIVGKRFAVISFGNPFVKIALRKVDQLLYLGHEELPITIAET